LTAGLALLLEVAAAWAGASVGSIAPDFLLPDLEGRPVRLSEHRGRVVFLDFWATWCSACAPQLQCLSDVAARYGDRDVDVIAVSIDRNPTVVERFVAERLPSNRLTVLHDAASEVLARFGAEGLPALYLIDRAGRITATHAGDGGCDALQTKLERLLEPRPATLVTAASDP
jgi:peroxiredoxin